MQSILAKSSGISTCVYLKRHEIIPCALCENFASLRLTVKKPFCFRRTSYGKSKRLFRECCFESAIYQGRTIAFRWHDCRVQKKGHRYRRPIPRIDPSRKHHCLILKHPISLRKQENRFRRNETFGYKHPAPSRDGYSAWYGK